MVYTKQGSGAALHIHIGNMGSRFQFQLYYGGLLNLRIKSREREQQKTEEHSKSVEENLLERMSMVQTVELAILRFLKLRLHSSDDRQTPDTGIFGIMNGFVLYLDRF